MLQLIVAVAMLSLVDVAPVCRVGTGAGAWTGSPVDLAMIEARYQREQAEGDRRAYPTGAPEPSPWTAFVTCREATS